MPSLQMAEGEVKCYLCARRCNSVLQSETYTVPVCGDCCFNCLDYEVDKKGHMTKILKEAIDR